MRESTGKIYIELKHELQKDYGVNMLVPTERELCQRFNVGRSAIRTVLHQLEQDGILRSRGSHCMRQIAVAEKKINKVLVFQTPREIFRQTNESFRILSGMSNAIHERHGEIIPIFAEYGPILEELCKSYSPDEYSGIIFHELYSDWYQRLRNYGIPAVIANYEGNRNVAASSVDFRQVGRIAGIEFLKKGYRRVAFIGRLEGFVNDEIAAGLRGALAEERIWFEDNLVIPYKYYDDAQQTNVRVAECLRQMLKSKERPEGFLVFRHQRNQLLLRIAEELHVRIPEDMEIIVYDAPTADVGQTPVSLLQEPVEELGRSAVEILLNQHVVSSEERIFLPPKYIPGNNCNQ